MEEFTLQQVTRCVTSGFNENIWAPHTTLLCFSCQTLMLNKTNRKHKNTSLSVLPPPLSNTNKATKWFIATVPPKELKLTSCPQSLVKSSREVESIKDIPRLILCS